MLIILYVIVYYVDYPTVKSNGTIVKLPIVSEVAVYVGDVS